MAGYAQGTDAINLGTVSITSCINNASIKSTKGNFGGIIASNVHLERLTIKDCVNNGNITSTNIKSNVGGIIGYLNTINGNILIENCVNNGNIELEAANVGGIIGYATNKNAVGGVIINNCTNKGEINTTGNVGGLIGTTGGNSYVTLKNSVNSGKIDSTGSAGGLAHSFDGEIINCTNNGEINAVTAVGAVIKAGAQNKSTIIIKKFVNNGKLVKKDGKDSDTAYMFGAINNTATIEDINSTYEGKFIINWVASTTTFKGTVSFKGDIFLKQTGITKESIILADNASVIITGDITSNGNSGIDTITLGAGAKFTTKSNNFYLTDSNEGGQIIAGQASENVEYEWQKIDDGTSLHGWKQKIVL